MFSKVPKYDNKGFWIQKLDSISFDSILCC